MFENYKDIKLDLIKINRENIINYAENFSPELLIIPEWKEDAFFIEDTEKDIEFLFLINTINFSYWQDENIDKWTVDFNGKNYSGSMALFVAFKKAILNGYPLFEPNYLKNISENDLMDILSGTSIIPMLSERLNILREVGNILLKNNLSGFTDILKSANKSSINLIEKLSLLFPSFRDTGIYKEQKFEFYKRAQLICAMLYGRYHGKSYGEFYDIDNLIIFTDYRVPQTIRKLGLIEYSSKFSEQIENKIYFQPRSPEELEIRISAIIATEYLREIINKKYKKNIINALQMDYFLWKSGKKISEPDFDFHRTRTIFY